jgi:AraC family transcriptional regulator
LLKDTVRRPAFTVAGVRALFDDENKHGIPMLWPRLIRCLPLAGQTGEGTYGVCAMADKQEGVLSYMAGVEVEGDAALPDGFERRTLVAQTYAVFRIVVDGTDLHPQMQAAMPEIWGRLLPEAGLKTVAAPVFEYYPPGFEPNRNGVHVDIYVPVEG